MSGVGAFARRALNSAAMLGGFPRATPGGSSGSPGRAQRALYAGRKIGVGNQVSFSEHK
jgi:hypothetical protein